MKKIGFYHMNCDDGSMSAAIARRFVEGIELYPTSYQHEWKDVEINEGDWIYFLDFCPPPEDLADIYYNKKAIIQVIDHHASAIEKMDVYWEKESKKANLLRSHCLFKIDACGATLTWGYFNKNQRRADYPRALDYIEIADTWQWDRDPNAKAVTQYIRTVTKLGSIDDMDNLLDNFDYAKAVANGELLHQRLINDCMAYAKRASYIDIKGHKVLAVNSIHGSSEIGHMLAEKSEIGVGAVYTLYPKDGYVRFSFRGDGKTNLARVVAQSIGGGGHDQAAGADMPLEEFFKILSK